ncbi:hypothetical protein V1512DRAFT_218105 [Lipomyces arxii]|uniref:uncharacterized protein n=1 Tax=Lipomyces arxii TaxID=56418 RepID=UPI0034CE13F2
MLVSSYPRVWSIVFRILQGVVIGIFANILGQYISAKKEDKKFSLNYLLVAEFCLFGVFFTPILLAWQAILDKYFPSIVERRDRDHSLAKSTEISDIELVGINSFEKSESTTRNRSQYAHGNIFIKVLLSETLFSICTNTVFVAYISLLQRLNAEQIWKQIETKVPGIWYRSLTVWPIVSYITFGFVPVHLRILFQSFVGIFWSIYMSVVSTKVN